MHETAVICEVVDIVLKTAKDNALEKNYKGYTAYRRVFLCSRGSTEI